MRERDREWQEIQKVAVAAVAIASIILLDQISKAIFRSNCNSGIAFGLFQNSGLLSIVIPGVVILGCFYFLARQERKSVSFALVLIIGGGLSNILDRLMMGCVRDFIDLTWISPRLALWPSFNLADSAVSAGVTILIFAVLIKSKAKKSNVSIH